MFKHRAFRFTTIGVVTVLVGLVAYTGWIDRSLLLAGAPVESVRAETRSELSEEFGARADLSASTDKARQRHHSHSTPVTLGGRELAPSKPMSALHFVKPNRYLMHSGETVRVSLTLVASQLAERVMVTARSDLGTELVSKPQFFLGSLNPWQEVTVWFDVTVLTEGRHYVSVVAQAETPAGPRFTSYAVPVEALLGGPAKQTRVSPSVYDAQGNRLKLMPAANPESQ